MKLVAPADLKGPHCLDHKRGEQCKHIMNTHERACACAMYGCGLVSIGRNGYLMKCAACVDVLGELEDR